MEHKFDTPYRVYSNVVCYGRAHQTPYKSLVKLSQVYLHVLLGPVLGYQALCGVLSRE